MSVKLSTVLDISIIGLLVSFLSVSNALSEISQIRTNLNGSFTAVAKPGIATESTTTTEFKPNWTVLNKPFKLNLYLLEFSKFVKLSIVLLYPLCTNVAVAAAPAPPPPENATANDVAPAYP